MLKRKSYSVTDKLVVIAGIKHSESQTIRYQDKGVADSTIPGWLRDKDKHDFTDMADSADQMKRKRHSALSSTQLNYLYKKGEDYSVNYKDLSHILPNSLDLNFSDLSLDSSLHYINNKPLISIISIICYIW